MYAKQRLSKEAVRAAHDHIKHLIVRTPVITSGSLSRAASSMDLNIEFFLKCENLQKSGSFKFRGASNFIANLPDEKLRKGVLAVSTGNFGFAVSLAAQAASRARSIPVEAAVVLPSAAAPSKIAGAKKNGAHVVLAGTTQQDRDDAARQIVNDTGATLVGPMDNHDIVLGQGTTTLEFIEQVQNAGGPSLDAIVLPSATGGILSGAAVVCKGSKTLVFGCEPESGGPDLHGGLRRKILPRPSGQNSVADGLRASCSKGNFDLISQLVDGFYCVTEDQIKDAWRLTIDELRLVVEPSSAVAIATVMFNHQFRAMLASRKRHWNIGIVLTGGNTNARRVQAELGS